MEANKTIEQLKQEQQLKKELPTTGKEPEKTISEKFMDELNFEEKEIFLKIKETRIETCEYEEFEAVTEDSLDDYAKLITYIKEKKVIIADNGVILKVRRPIKNDRGEEITDKLKVLFERNEGREREFTKKIRLKKGDNSAFKDYSQATMAASLENVNYNGTPIIISTKHVSKMHKLDYELLGLIFDFFRT